MHWVQLSAQHLYVWLTDSMETNLLVLCSHSNLFHSKAQAGIAVFMDIDGKWGRWALSRGAKSLVKSLSGDCRVCLEKQEASETYCNQFSTGLQNTTASSRYPSSRYCFLLEVSLSPTWFESEMHSSWGLYSKEVFSHTMHSLFPTPKDRAWYLLQGAEHLLYFWSTWRYAAPASFT